MHRADILNKAAELTTKDRNKSYGEPYDNLSMMAGMITAYLIGKYRGTTLDENTFELTAEDAAHFMTFAKISRTPAKLFHPDNYIDSACYEAIAGECRSIDEED